MVLTLNEKRKHKTQEKETQKGDEKKNVQKSNVVMCRSPSSVAENTWRNSKFD